MNNFLNTFLQALTPIITLLLEVGLVLLVAIATKFVKKYLTKLGISIDNDQLKVIEDLVYQTVTKLNQTTVDTMKNLASDGKLTDDQQTFVYDTAYTAIVNALSEDQLGLIEKIYGDTDTGIETLIENMVVKAKDYRAIISADSLLEVSTEDVEELE